MFKKRSYQKEWMDELDSSGEVIVQTLKELDYINRKLGGNNISLHALESLVRKSGKREFTLADLGCGGGDILKEMAIWARKKGIKLTLVGIDANPAIIDYAQKNCSGFPEISFTTTNIFGEEFRQAKFDIYHSSLFTHHFTEIELVDLLSICYANCSTGIIINDLQRHWFAYFAIKWLTKFFSKSPMVQHDASVSVQRGFHKQELIEVLKKAGISPFTIHWRWAFRWKVVGYSE